MRGLLIFITILLVYYALKAVFRSAFIAYHEENGRTQQRQQGEDMVMDPECRTYVIKDRAVTRRIGKSIHFFCSEECAQRYEEAHRG
jgi:YHS domain-containing protein